MIKLEIQVKVATLLHGGVSLSCVFEAVCCGRLEENEMARLACSLLLTRGVRVPCLLRAPKPFLKMALEYCTTFAVVHGLGTSEYSAIGVTCQIKTRVRNPFSL